MDEAVTKSSKRIVGNKRCLNGAEKDAKGENDEEKQVEDREKGDEEEQCDVEVWETLSKSFKQVQSLLDQNRVLIQQVNENHQSKTRENMTKNVALIRQINGNISKVLNMYSDLSFNFSNIVHRRREIMEAKKG